MAIESWSFFPRNCHVTWVRSPDSFYFKSVPWWTDPLPIKQSKNVPRNSANQIRTSSFRVRTHLLSFSSKLTNLLDIFIGRSRNRNVETNQKINLRYNTAVYIANKLLWFNYRHFSFKYCNAIWIIHGLNSCKKEFKPEQEFAWKLQFETCLDSNENATVTLFSLYIDTYLRKFARVTFILFIKYFKNKQTDHRMNKVHLSWFSLPYPFLLKSSFTINIYIFSPNILYFQLSGPNILSFIHIFWALTVYFQLGDGNAFIVQFK